MATYVGEIKMFAGNFAPQGWAFCNGQLLAIVENETLFQLLGTTYGGDGQNTFALPDLRGRAPMHQGNSYNVGQKGGVEQVVLELPQMPAHTHTFSGSNEAASSSNPTGNVVANSGKLDLYVKTNPDANTNPQNISAAGGNQQHENMQPFLVISYIISLFGTFPQT